MAETAGKKYLAKITKKKGVHKLPSGMRFEILTRVDDVEGRLSPRLSDPCDVHYHGTLINGKVFDSSVDRGAPLSFAPNQVIKGWTEALQYMAEGEKWKVYLPHNLAYGPSGSPPDIPPYSALIFTIELLKVKGPGKPAAAGHALLEKKAKKTYAEL
ncbi:FKBP-type peptidyl-prolyl cis-trans isomerase FklB [Strigomonas culicis]|uniref:peptidylprolyl isomerase n=1 Tax=Strigomonas culicis TaxID=28005 RepID=S9UNX0_9TRYP|nr:FKBP-type peptidyl-prolyl cis-trans isomerase FklB [Strigomonas culicis]|eukprot:EPY30593.1 FKBP-type peptidyl-prolyl cis-trans isomerase FklB [Strigomonas culicis]